MWKKSTGQKDKKNFQIPIDKGISLCYNKYRKKRKEQIKMEKIDKRMFKKEGEELQQYLAFRRKGGKVPAKKGKGSYNRKSFKKEVA